MQKRGMIYDKFEKAARSRVVIGRAAARRSYVVVVGVEGESRCGARPFGLLTWDQCPKIVVWLRFISMQDTSLHV